MILIHRKVRLEERTRTDKRHVAPQNIPALRQLVETPTAEQRAEARHTRILGNLEETCVAAAIEMRQFVLLCIRTNTHRAELQHSETSTTKARSVLREEDRSG